MKKSGNALTYGYHTAVPLWTMRQDFNEIVAQREPAELHEVWICLWITRPAKRARASSTPPVSFLVTVRGAGADASISKVIGLGHLVPTGGKQAAMFCAFPLGFLQLLRQLADTLTRPQLDLRRPDFLIRSG